jgi:hypothetical protein
MAKRKPPAKYLSSYDITTPEGRRAARADLKARLKELRDTAGARKKFNEQDQLAVKKLKSENKRKP